VWFGFTFHRVGFVFVFFNFGLQKLGLGVDGSWFMVYSLWFRVCCLGMRVCVWEFDVQGLGLRDWSSGCKKMDREVWIK